jgi:hypothetical protein
MQQGEEEEEEGEVRKDDGVTVAGVPAQGVRESLGEKRQLQPTGSK